MFGSSKKCSLCGKKVNVFLYSGDDRHDLKMCGSCSYSLGSKEFERLSAESKKAVFWFCVKTGIIITILWFIL